MNYEQFPEQMKDDLTARFARDLPPELADRHHTGSPAVRTVWLIC